MTTTQEYEDAQSKMPEGWVLWGNYGDGKWRASTNGSQSYIVPANTIQEAVKRAWIAYAELNRL